MVLGIAFAAVTFASTMVGGYTALRWPQRKELLMALAGGEGGDGERHREGYRERTGHARWLPEDRNSMRRRKARRNSHRP